MAKPEKKRQARALRKKGKSIIWIANEIGVSKSSVSVWTRDIELTEEQEANLRFSNERREAQVKGARANVIKHRQKRRKYQEEGRQKARDGDPLHLAGCMLYWAEGFKSRNEIKFVNSDPDMIVVFMKFLRQSLNIKDESMKIRVNAYLHEGKTEDEIIDYWLKLVQLDSSSLNKSRFNARPSSSNDRGRILEYGVCEILVYSTRHIQHMYGAIQEYMGFEKPEWLDIK